MKKLLLFLLLSAGCCKVYAQYYTGIIYPVYKNGKMGYIDNTGTIRINATEEPIPSYQLKNIIQPVYSPVYKTYYGLYNRFIHKMILDYKYESVTIDTVNRLVRVALPVYKSNSYGVKNYVGFVDFDGRQVIPPVYIGAFNNASSFHFSEGLWAFAFGSHDNWLEGYMNTKGHIVIPATFARAEDFSNGFAVVQLPGSKKKGVIDKTGKLVIPATFEGIHRFSKNGYAFAQPGLAGLAYVVIDKKGTVINTLKGLELQPGLGDYIQANGYCRVYNRTTMKQGFVTDRGDIAIPVIYNYVSPDISGDMVIANTGGSLDPKGGFTGGKWTLVDLKGKQLFPPIAAEKVQQLSEGMAAIRINGKWGFIDTKGQLVVQPQWTEMPDKFSNGLARVFGEKEDIYQKTRLMGYINLQGKLVWPMQK